MNPVRAIISITLGAASTVALAVGVVRHPAAVAAVTLGFLVMAYCLGRVPVFERWSWWLLALVLAGYAFWGRTFAGLGYGAIYIGEVTLFVTVSASISRSSIWRPIHSTSGLLLLLFVTWCALRTAPFVRVYGTDALRDGATWGYALFALVTAGAILQCRSHHGVLVWYSRLLWVYLTWLLVVGSARVLGQQALSVADFSAGVLLKPGDVSVHLAGIAAFLLLGLHRTGPLRTGRGWIGEWCLWPVWLLNFLLSASQNRGGLLSVLVALAIVLLLWSRSGWWKPATVSVLVLSAFWFWGLEADVGGPRKVSVEQVLANLLSVTGDAGPVSEGTRQWRLSWWRKIWGYTVEGDFFWVGKGFGLNLADDDGFQTNAEHSLRSPHNGHLTVLARAGVPGFALWILLQGSLWLSLLRRFFREKREGNLKRAAFIVWVLAYLAAMTVNGAFDVYLEGPQGGIWFWVVFGVGMSIIAEPVRRRCGTAVRVPAFRHSPVPASAV